MCRTQHSSSKWLVTWSCPACRCPHGAAADATARVGLLRVSRVPSAAGRAGSWAPGRRPAPAPSGRPPEAGVLPSSRQGRVTPPIRPADVQREETGTADALPGGRCEPLTPVPAPCPWRLPLTPAGLTATYANEAHGSRVVVAEWLRRWTRNPLGSPRAGSNPADYGAPPPTWGPSYCRRLSREGSDPVLSGAAARLRACPDRRRRVSMHFCTSHAATVLQVCPCPRGGARLRDAPVSAAVPAPLGRQRVRPGGGRGVHISEESHLRLDACPATHGLATGKDIPGNFGSNTEESHDREMVPKS